MMDEWQHECRGLFGIPDDCVAESVRISLYKPANGIKAGNEIGYLIYNIISNVVNIIATQSSDDPDLMALAGKHDIVVYNGHHGVFSLRLDRDTEFVLKRNFLWKYQRSKHWNIVAIYLEIAQQVDSAEASTIAVPPSGPSGSPR